MAPPLAVFFSLAATRRCCLPRLSPPPKATALEKMHWALLEYAKRESGSDVAKSFVVPQQTAWPEELWGMELGKAVDAARTLEALASDDEAKLQDSLFQKDRDHPSLPRLSRTPWGKRLTAIGFDWKDAKEDRKYRILVGALEAYVKEHGDAVLPRNFKVPKREPYPPETWGENLDHKLYNFKFYRENVAAYPDRQAELRDLGFVWERLQPEFNLVVQALRVFKAREGHLKVPTSFVVPTLETDDDDDDPWPVGTHGMPLGRLCVQIRSRNDFVAGDLDKWKQLNDLGFPFVAPQTTEKSLLDEALDRYRDLYDADEPPLTFVVPPHDENWPRRLRGFELGKRRYYAKRRSDAAHLNRNLIDRRFDTFARALTAFVHLHGHADVPQKFVVPSDTFWPRDCRGMPLGQRVAHIRSKGYYVQHSDTDPRAQRRKQILDELGFLWHKNKKRQKNRPQKKNPHHHHHQQEQQRVPA